MTAPEPLGLPVALTRLPLSWTPDPDRPGRWHTSAHDLPWQLVENDPVPEIWTLLCDRRLVARASALPEHWTFEPGTPTHPGLLELCGDPTGVRLGEPDPFSEDSDLREPSYDVQGWINHDGELWHGAITGRGLVCQVLTVRGLLPLDIRARLANAVAVQGGHRMWAADPDDSTGGQAIALLPHPRHLGGLVRGIPKSEPDGGGLSSRLVVIAPDLPIAWWSDRTAKVAVVAGPAAFVPFITGRTQQAADKQLARTGMRLLRTEGPTDPQLVALEHHARLHLGRVPWHTGREPR